ncbi:YfcE family phosphodiesterase [Halorubrum sp. N11]|uniref:YfcE family phosphodiesterase n=1 Tax=Halorubrum sp. N11 TaxID=3402276 RepID=UPI003EBEA75E
MRIGIVSDTHDDLAAVEAAVSLFDCEGVDVVVHCGDFVAPFSVTPFDVGDGPDADGPNAGGDAPDAGFDFYAARGNNDGEWAVQSTVESFGTYLGEAGALSFGGSGGGDDAVDVAVTHGTSAVVVDALVDCGDYDYVFHGHTHAHGVEERDGTVRVNPGGLPIPVEGADEAFRVAILDVGADADGATGADAVTHHVLDL